VRPPTSVHCSVLKITGFDISFFDVFRGKSMMFGMDFCGTSALKKDILQYRASAGMMDSRPDGKLFRSIRGFLSLVGGMKISGQLDSLLTIKRFHGAICEANSSICGFIN